MLPDVTTEQALETASQDEAALQPSVRQLCGLLGLARTLTSYGYHRDQLDRDLRRRLLAWSILPRYSNLKRWMERLPEPGRPTLDALADCWFGTG